MKKIYQRLFGSSLTFRQILFNIISFVGLIGGTISLIVSLATGLPVVQDIVVTAALAVLVLCLYLANEKGLIQLASVIIILLVTVVLLPMMFFTGGGVYSGMKTEGSKMLPLSCLPEERLEDVFRLMAEAVEEAVLNSLTEAQPAQFLDGRTCHSLAEFLGRCR